jgi:hypothetical protein
MSGQQTTAIIVPYRMPELMENHRLYTLDGRQVNGSLRPGVYIRNGKKLIIQK